MRICMANALRPLCAHSNILSHSTSCWPLLMLEGFTCIASHYTCICVTWPLAKALQPVCVKRRTECVLKWPGDWQRVAPFVYQCKELDALPCGLTTGKGLHASLCVYSNAPPRLCCILALMHVGLRLCRN